MAHKTVESTVTTSATEIFQAHVRGSRNGVPEMGIQVTNGGSVAFTELNVYARVGPGSDWVLVADALVDFTTQMTWPLHGSASSDGTFNLLAASASCIIHIHTGAIDAIKLTAKVGSSTAACTVASRDLD